MYFGVETMKCNTKFSQCDFSKDWQLMKCHVRSSFISSQHDWLRIGFICTQVSLWICLCSAPVSGDQVNPASRTGDQAAGQKVGEITLEELKISAKFARDPIKLYTVELNFQHSCGHIYGNKFKCLRKQIDSSMTIYQATKILLQKSTHRKEHTLKPWRIVNNSHYINFLWLLIQRISVWIFLFILGRTKEKNAENYLLSNVITWKPWNHCY